MSKNKKPADLTGKKFGIEIEFASRSDVKRDVRTRLSNMIQAGEISNGWEIKYDGSVSPGNNEIVSPILTYNYPDSYQEIKRICDMIKHVQGYINGTCGFHVHNNYKGNSERGLIHLAREFFSKQSLIFDMFRVLPSRQNTFCKRSPEKYVRLVKGSDGKTIYDTSDARAWFNKQTFSEINHRYMGLNLTSLVRHGTAEYRVFNGTLNPDKIFCYVQFTLALTNKASKAKRSSKAIKKYNALTARYDSRTWLLRLGLIGKEFEKTRKIIRENLPETGHGFKSDTAWRKARHGRGNGTPSPEIEPAETFNNRQFI